MGQLDEVFTFAGLLLFSERGGQQTVKGIGFLFGLGVLTREVLVSELKGDEAVAAGGLRIFIAEGRMGSARGWILLWLLRVEV
jgi:hypothetical protein